LRTAEYLHPVKVVDVQRQEQRCLADIRMGPVLVESALIPRNTKLLRLVGP
jgi:hypothetical protein